MKKTIPVLLSGIIISFAIISLASAQSSHKSVAIGIIKNNPALTNYINENNSGVKGVSGPTNESLMTAKGDLKISKANLKALKANLRATESFKREFKDCPDVTWRSIKDGILASFSKDGVKTTVVYNKKGFWIHTLSYFPAEKTPASVRSIVETNYPNADITSSVQVKERDMEFFVVNLEDKRTIKQVAVYNDETNLINEYNKGN